MDQCSKERFLAACGLSGPLRLNLKEGAGDEFRLFEVPFVVAGRAPGADLILDHPTISRRHVYLQAIAGRIFYVDLGSRTGVGGEGGRACDGWIDGWRGIRIGPVQIRAVDEAWPLDLEDPLRSHCLGSSPLPDLTLEFPENPGRPLWKVRRVLTLVGRGSECRLRVLDPDVSKFHCSLLRTPDGVWVVDLLGRTGIELNGQSVRWARLEHGDRLRVGSHQIGIRIRCESPRIDRPGPAERTVGALAVVPPRLAQPATLLAQPATLLEMKNDWSQNSLAHPAVEMSEPVMMYIANLFGQMQQQMFARFGQMQQQMFDQLQQATLMMAQTLGTLQRDQIALVRDELDRLRQLNQDLLTLQVQADRENLPLPALPSTPATGSANGGFATEESLARIEALLEASLAASGSPASEVVTTAPTDPASKTQRGPSTPIGREKLPEAIEDGTRTRESVASLKPSNGPPRGSAPNHEAAPSGRLPDENIHDFLCQRIASLQQERQGRWQRICDLMLGR